MDKTAQKETPVGMIEYLCNDGKPFECVTYTDAELFEKDILRENYYCVPINVTLIRDVNSQIPVQGLPERLDPPPQGFIIVDMAVEYIEPGYAEMLARCAPVQISCAL